MTLYRLGLCFSGLMLMLLSLNSDSLVAQENQKQPQEQIASDEIASLLLQLESERYQSRIAASRQLEKFGVEIAPALVAKILLGPPETAVRCSQVLSRIALNADQQDMTRVARILLLLSENGLHHFQRDSLMLQARWKKNRQDRTIELLVDAGIDVRSTGFGTGLSAVMPLHAAIDGTQMEQTEESSELEIEGPTASQPNTAVASELLADVNAIISASDAENGIRYAEEMRSVGLGSKETDNSASAQQSGRPDVIVPGVVWSQTEQDAFFNIVVQENAKLGTEELNLLELLPGSLQITFVQREISPVVIDALATMKSAQYVGLINCRYELEPMFDLLKKRPGLYVSATGNEGFLGVQLESDFAFESQLLCRVLEVVPNSAAEDAGIQAGDLFRRVNGIPISRSEEVILAIGAFKPGDVLTLDLVRDTKELEMKVELRERMVDP